MRRARFLALLAAAALVGTLAAAPVAAAPAAPVTFAILHTNDFHGQLEVNSGGSTSNPGLAKLETQVETVETEVGAGNVLLVDVGDEMQGSLLSNLGDGTPTGKGMPTIAAFNKMRTGETGYDVATFGNHEFDWGQVNLANRTAEAIYPYVTANIVQNDTGNCATAGWTPPTFADAPYTIKTIGTAPNAVKVAFVGVTTTETPTITVSTATAGLCFKDPADSDPPLLRPDEGRRRGRRRGPQPPRPRGRRLRLRDPRLRRQDPRPEADHGRQAGEPDPRRPQPHEHDLRVRRRPDDDRAVLLQRPHARPRERDRQQHRRRVDHLAALQPADRPGARSDDRRGHQHIRDRSRLPRPRQHAHRVQRGRPRAAATPATT